VQVEIWSDLACPWCYVGKRRFEAALARFPRRQEVQVTWRSFELDPEAPAERPEDAPTHLARKYGTSVEQARAMNEELTRLAAGEGLEYHLDRLRLGNTFDAHRLVHLAAARGLQDAMEERLMRAYFAAGELLSDRDTLERLAADVGLPGDETREVLVSDRFADAVRQDEQTATALGIHAVPFFVVDRRIAASGAQPPDTLLHVLDRAADPTPA
jgi:predicted DsbA family dithiol-disulfide isomerase